MAEGDFLSVIHNLLVLVYGVLEERENAYGHSLQQLFGAPQLIFFNIVAGILVRSLDPILSKFYLKTLSLTFAIIASIANFLILQDLNILPNLILLCRALDTFICAQLDPKKSFVSTMKELLIKISIYSVQVKTQVHTLRKFIWGKFYKKDDSSLTS